MDSYACMQAAGLLELQDGRTAEAVQLLQHAVQQDARLAPVLQWKAVQDAMRAQQGGTQAPPPAGVAAAVR